MRGSVQELTRRELYAAHCGNVRRYLMYSIMLLGFELMFNAWWATVTAAKRSAQPIIHPGAGSIVRLFAECDTLLLRPCAEKVQKVRQQETGQRGNHGAA